MTNGTFILLPSAEWPDKMHWDAFEILGERRIVGRTLNAKLFHKDLSKEPISRVFLDAEARSLAREEAANIYTGLALALIENTDAEDLIFLARAREALVFALALESACDGAVAFARKMGSPVTARITLEFERVLWPASRPTASHRLLAADREQERFLKSHPSFGPEIASLTGTIDPQIDQDAQRRAP